MYSIIYNFIFNRKNPLFWVISFFVGGAGYCAIEVMWRGHTHISMGVAGGICFCLLILIKGMAFSFAERCFVGGVCISAVELVTGAIVNIYMGLNVWDYSGEALHLFGQICPRFFILWCILSGLVMFALGKFPEMAAERGAL